MARNVFVRAPAQADTRTRRNMARLTDLDVQTAQQPSLIVLDTMTEPAVTSLALHRLDVPSAVAWVSDAGSTVAQVLGNDKRIKFDQAGHTGNMVWYTATGFSNCTISLTVNIPSVPNNTLSDAGIMFRFQDDNNYSIVTLGPSTGGVKVFEKAGGVFTQRAFTAFTVNYDKDYSIIATLLGSTITAVVNPNSDNKTVSYNALVVNTGGTSHGVRFAGDATSDFMYAITPFRITAP